METILPIDRLISDETARFRQFAVIVGIALLAFLLRAAPLLRQDVSFAFIHDASFWFLETAAGMLHGCGFARWIGGACVAPEIMRTPGYPLMLTLLPNARWTLAVQDMVGGFVCIFVAYWVWRVWGIRAALIAELFIALDLPSIVFGNLVMSEQLFQFMVLVAMVPPLLVASGRFTGSTAITVAVLSALSACIAILVRPIGILIPFLTPIPYLCSSTLHSSQRLRLAVIAIMLPMLTEIGWSTRNYTEAGYFGVSIEGPISLYFFRAAEVVARENSAGLLPTQQVMGQQLGVGMDHIYDTNCQSAQLANRMDRLATNVLLSYPLEAMIMTFESAIYIGLFPMRSPVANMLGIHGGSQGWGLASGAPSVSRFRSELSKMLHSGLLTALVALQALIGLTMWVGVSLALVRCVWCSTNYRIWVLCLTLVSMVMILVGAGGEADVRFREPVVPLLAVVAALGYMRV